MEHYLTLFERILTALDLDPAPEEATEDAPEPSPAKRRREAAPAPARDAKKRAKK